MHNFVEEIKSGIRAKKGRIYTCTCGCDALVIEFPEWEEEDWEEFDYCNISIWKDWSHHETLWGKLKMIWRILTIGYPYTDNVCLNREQFNKLKEFVQSKKDNKRKPKRELGYRG